MLFDVVFGLRQVAESRAGGLAPEVDRAAGWPAPTAAKGLDLGGYYTDTALHRWPCVRNDAQAGADANARHLGDLRATHGEIVQRVDTLRSMAAAAGEAQGSSGQGGGGGGGNGFKTSLGATPAPKGYTVNP
jgi:hypothetical protein